MGKKLRTVVKHLCIEEAAIKCAMTTGGVARLNQFSALKRRFGKKAANKAMSEARNVVKMMGLEDLGVPTR